MVMGTVVWCPNRLANKETHCLQKHDMMIAVAQLQQQCTQILKLILHNIVERMKHVASCK
jgi:hypothetical protein